MTANLKRDEPKHWATLEEHGVYFGLRFLLAVYRVLGRRGFALFLCPVTVYFVIAGTQARRASRQFLDRVYEYSGAFSGSRATPSIRHIIKHIYHFAEAILDKIAAWSGDIALEDFDHENRAVFERLLKDGKGGLLIASHLGNAEVCRALGRLSLDIKMNVLVYTRHSNNFNRVIQRVNPESTVSLIQTTDVDPTTAMMLSERINRGEFVVIAGDRTPIGYSARVSWVPFLGRPAPFPQGPYILASVLRCPVVLFFCLKKAGQYQIVFEHFSDGVSLPRSQRAATLDELAQRYAARLEHHCIGNPFQWYNFFDFWNQAAAPDRHREKREASQKRAS